MSEHPILTAVVVSWNVREQLELCLASLQASQNVSLHIVVIDNGSTDGSSDMAREKFPDATLISNPDNRGFSVAVNQGIAKSSGDVVLVNPDLELEPDTLAKLEDALRRDPHTGIVGPKISYPDGILQPSIRRFPTTRDLLLTLFKLPNFFPALTSNYAGLEIDYSLEQTVDQVMGSCFLIRRQTLESVGLFDEGFFLWFEEVDFCKRAAQHGWLTMYVPTAHAQHEKGASFSQQRTLWKHQKLVQSMVHYAKKHLGFWSGEIIFATGVATSILALGQQLLNLRKPQRAKNL